MASSKIAWQTRKYINYVTRYPLPTSLLVAFRAFGRSSGICGTMWLRNGPAGLTRRTIYYSSASPLMQKSKWTGDKIATGEKQKDKLFLPQGMISSPQNIQVYADPTLAKCVRDLVADMQAVKSTVNYTKEEVADCVYEYIRLNNSYDALKTDVKETSKLSRDLAKEAEANAKSFQAKHKELENCLLYFTEKTVTHENQMTAINRRQDEIMKRLEEFVSSLDGIIDEVAELRVAIREEFKPEVDGVMMLAKLLGADDGSLQVDVKNIADDLLRIKKLLNDTDFTGEDWTTVGTPPDAGTPQPKSSDTEGGGPHKS